MVGLARVLDIIHDLGLIVILKTGFVFVFWYSPFLKDTFEHHAVAEFRAS
jgi:hypothetical protein